MHQLIAQLEQCDSNEREKLVMFLETVGEIDAQRLYEEEGYPSAYQFLQRRFNKAEGCAYNRVHVARVARRYPQILELIRSGRLHMTAVVLLEKHLKPQNAAELLTKACGKSKREIEKMLKPKPPVPEPKFTSPQPSNPIRMGNDASDLAHPIRMGNDAPDLVLGQPEPKSGKGHVRLNFEVEEEVFEALKDLKAELKGATFNDVLKLLIKNAKPKPKRPSPAPKPASEPAPKPASEPAPKPVSKPAPKPGRRPAIPAAVKREVRSRGDGRCCYESPSGIRCPETRGLQLDHVVPRSQGGLDIPQNLREICPEHNRMLARRKLGPDYRPPKPRSPVLEQRP